MSREELLRIRKEKLRKEIESAKRILKSGIEPLRIADQFIDDTFKLIENGIISRNPNADLEEIQNLVRQNLVLKDKIKLLRKKRG
ncbi:MAG: hypothetical protein ACFFAO_16870 [Candidatus Hermodarchaeota archaeon]